MSYLVNRRFRLMKEDFENLLTEIENNFNTKKEDFITRLDIIKEEFKEYLESYDAEPKLAETVYFGMNNINVYNETPIEEFVNSNVRNLKYYALIEVGEINEVINDYQGFSPIEISINFIDD